MELSGSLALGAIVAPCAFCKAIALRSSCPRLPANLDIGSKLKRDMLNGYFLSYVHVFGFGSRESDNFLDQLDGHYLAAYANL